MFCSKRRAAPLRAVLFFDRRSTVRRERRSLGAAVGTRAQPNEVREGGDFPNSAAVGKYDLAPRGTLPSPERRVPVPAGGNTK